jgi:hypothetical protein
MTIWEWVHAFEVEARACGDRERLRLPRLHLEAYSHREADPGRMVALLEEGRRLAQRLGEPWWVLFFEHWQVEALVYYTEDYREVVDRAVRLTLELRKPAHEGHPLRFGVHCNLVAAYLCVDPRGHADSIRAALDYLQTQVPPSGGDRYLLQARRHWFAYELGRLDEAHALALEELALADADPDLDTARHHEVDTYKALCRIAFRQESAALEGYAAAGEERARAIGYRHELALFLLWQAFTARLAGREQEARRLARRGAALMARVGQPPDDSYFDALCAYHEQGGQLDSAWELRERELAECVAKGKRAGECLCRLKRCRLLARLGRPLDDEARGVRAAAARLRAPGWYLGELERL